MSRPVPAKVKQAQMRAHASNINRWCRDALTLLDSRTPHCTLSNFNKKSVTINVVFVKVTHNSMGFSLMDRPFKKFIFPANASRAQVEAEIHRHYAEALQPPEFDLIE